MMTRTSREERPKLYFSFMGGPILIEGLVVPETLRDLQALLQTMGCCWNNSANRWNCFSYKLAGYLSPLAVIIFQVVGSTFQTWYVHRRGGAKTWLNCQFSRKKYWYLYNNFVLVLEILETVLEIQFHVLKDGKNCNTLQNNVPAVFQTSNSSLPTPTFT